MADGPSVQRRPKNLVLILAREFASKLATPTFVNDAEGTLVYYNEPAEGVLGRSFAEAGEMPVDQWSSLFSVERPRRLADAARARSRAGSRSSSRSRRMPCCA